MERGNTGVRVNGNVKNKRVGVNEESGRVNKFRKREANMHR